MVQTVAKTLEVDPIRGVDQPSGRPHLPYKTLTAALVAAQNSALIRLAPGTYSAATGERFPLVVAQGVIVMGQETTQGQGVVITGGGAITGDAALSATVLLEGQGQLRGLTIQNPRGIGVLIRDGSPLVRACRFSQCGAAGLQVMGSASPLVMNGRFEAIAGPGLALAQQAKGEVRGCTFQGCGVGLQAIDGAAPLIFENHCTNNPIGLRVAGAASPVLRQNRLVQNQQWGLLVQERGRPDLGVPADGAGNSIRYNGQADLRNETGQVLLSVGNDLLPQRLVGAVALTPCQQPDPAAVPPGLLDQPVSPAAPPVAPPPVTSAPPPVASRFRDLQGHWAAPYIEALADRGLVKGFEDGTFRPNDGLSRAQFAALVAASFGTIPLVRGTMPFVDVPSNFWAAAAIDLAQRRGFVGGYPDQTFRPNQPMTRVQAIVALANGLKLAPAPASVLGMFGDRAQIPSYAIDALAAAVQAGMLLPFPEPTQLRPQDPITRAEAAVLIYQGLVALGQASPLGTTTVAPLVAAQGTFADIRTHWARDFIQGLLTLNLLRGHEDGRFYPDQPMTRAQFAVLIQAAFSPTPRRSGARFSDVPPGYWAAQAIQQAVRAGFLAGFPDGTFAPEHPMLRVQVWVALVHGLALLADQQTNLAPLERYRDRAALPTYALEAVARASQLGLVVTYSDGDQLHPHRVATRADVAAAIYQTLVLQNRLPRLASPALPRP